MKDLERQKNLVITSDKIVFSIVSFLIVIILILPGVFIFLYAPRALHIVAFFCFAEGMLPILACPFQEKRDIWGSRVASVARCEIPAPAVDFSSSG